MKSQSIVELVLVIVAFAVVAGVLNTTRVEKDYGFYKNEMGLITLLNEEYNGFSNAELLIAWSKGKVEDSTIIDRLNSSASKINDHYLIYVKNGSNAITVYDLYPCVRSKELHVAYINLSGVEVYFTSWSKWRIVEPC